MYDGRETSCTHLDLDLSGTAFPSYYYALPGAHHLHILIQVVADAEVLRQHDDTMDTQDTTILSTVPYSGEQYQTFPRRADPISPDSINHSGPLQPTNTLFGLRNSSITQISRSLEANSDKSLPPCRL